MVFHLIKPQSEPEKKKVLDGTKKNNFVTSKGSFIYPTRKETEMLSSGQTFVVDESNGLQDSIAIGDDVRDLNEAGDAEFVENNKKDAITSTEKNESDTRLYTKRLSKKGRIRKVSDTSSNAKTRSKEIAKVRNKKNEKIPLNSMFLTYRTNKNKLNSLPTPEYLRPQ